MKRISEMREQKVEEILKLNSCFIQRVIGRGLIYLFQDVFLNLYHLSMVLEVLVTRIRNLRFCGAQSGITASLH